VDIRFSPTARRQLLDATQALLEESTIAAQTFIDQVENALDRLKHFPNSGHPIQEAIEQQHRQVVVGQYRLFYRIKSEIVWIVGVWHHRQSTDEG
jgi:plasmid stabilization system protein ParE